MVNAFYNKQNQKIRKSPVTLLQSGAHLSRDRRNFLVSDMIIRHEPVKKLSVNSKEKLCIYRIDPKQPIKCLEKTSPTPPPHPATSIGKFRAWQNADKTRALRELKEGFLACEPTQFNYYAFPSP